MDANRKAAGKKYFTRCGILWRRNWNIHATVRAAEWWEVPWGTVAAYCTEQKKEELVRGMCCDCNAKMWADSGKRVRCPTCEAKARDRELSRKYQNRRFYADMHKK